MFVGARIFLTGDTLVQRPSNSGLFLGQSSQILFEVRTLASRFPVNCLQLSKGHQHKAE